MPLRTLLGYNPRDVSSRQSRADLPGRFITFAPTNQKVMASKKQKYQVPMARVKKLPPIDEESAGTPRSFPRFAQGRQAATVRRLPKSVFNEDDDDNYWRRSSPVKARPVISVKPMPRRRTPSPKEDPKKDIYHPIKPQYQTNFHLSPKDTNHTIVDGLVADYLHYSRYGHVIPVYEGTSSNTCPCCTDRNRQNVRTLLGFPGDMRTSGKLPTKYDHKSSVRNSKPAEGEEELDNDSYMYPNSMWAKTQRRKAQEKQQQLPTADEIRMQRIAEESRRGPWVNYQPLPYATNYLNPEFNRPRELNSLFDIESHNASLYTKNKVLEADSNFDSAMSKLGTFNFEDRQRPTY